MQKYNEKNPETAPHTSHTVITSWRCDTQHFCLCLSIFRIRAYLQKHSYFSFIALIVNFRRRHRTAWNFHMVGVFKDKDGGNLATGQTCARPGSKRCTQTNKQGRFTHRCPVNISDLLLCNRNTNTMLLRLKAKATCLLSHRKEFTWTLITHRDTEQVVHMKWNLLIYW